MNATYRFSYIFLLFALLAGGAAAQEMELDWSPDVSAYPETPTNWPLCGDTTNPSSSWTEGDPCTSTLPDRIVSSYGPRSSHSNYDFHRGIDLRTLDMESDDNSNCDLDCIPNTRPVFAVADGEVDKVQFKCEDGEPDGFRIRLKHGSSSSGKWYSRYVHMSSLAPLSTLAAPTCPAGEDEKWDLTDEFEDEMEAASQDTDVDAGEHIGYTGKSTSNNHHLHFEVRKDESWARSAIHPVRKLPAVTAPGSLDVSLHDVELDLPRIEVTGYRLDVVRAELQVAGCDELVLGADLECDPFVTVPHDPPQDGYMMAPTYYDYERLNYQYAHRGSSVWTNTSGFALCPFAADHGSKYNSDLHVTDSSFNSMTVTLTGGVDPYWRSFRFDDTDVPFYSGYDYTCTRAVAYTAGGSVAESDELACRATDGGTVVYMN